MAESNTCPKRIALACDASGRLHPAMEDKYKWTLPVYDKLAIRYPLSTLMLAGIHDILLTPGQQDRPRIEQLLSDRGN
jgi:glucose-1-phosphate thymidylyltransferase